MFQFKEGKRMNSFINEIPIWSTPCFSDKETYISARILSIPPFDLGLLLATGSLVLAGNAFLNLSLQMVEPTVVSLCRSLEIVIGYVFQVCILKESTSLHSVLGSSFVLFSVMAIALEKNVVGRVKNNVLKGLLWYWSTRVFSKRKYIICDFFPNPRVTHFNKNIECIRS